MYAIIHLGTSERVVESTNKDWLHNIVDGFKICKHNKTYNWRIVRPEYDVTKMDYTVYSKCEFEIMSIEHSTGDKLCYGI
jgi:hypothetical protein